MSTSHVHTPPDIVVQSMMHGVDVLSYSEYHPHGSWVVSCPVCHSHGPWPMGKFSTKTCAVGQLYRLGIFALSWPVDSGTWWILWSIWYHPPRKHQGRLFLLFDMFVAVMPVSPEPATSFSKFERVFWTKTTNKHKNMKIGALTPHPIPPQPLQCSILFYPISLYLTPSHLIPSHPTPSHPTPSHPTPTHPTPSHSPSLPLTIQLASIQGGYLILSRESLHTSFNLGHNLIPPYDVAHSISRVVYTQQ